MWPFGRRRRGRHALGAAVVDLPSAAPPTLAGSIAALIASGEAWADPGVRPAPYTGSHPTDPGGVAPKSLPTVAAAPVSVASPPDSVPPARVPAAMAAVRIELPALAPPRPVVSASRVQLGFRDGSTAVLDPDQAAALEELAGLLTSRD